MHVTLFDTGSPFVATVADLLEGLGMEFVRTAELPLPTQGPVDLGVVVVPVSGDAVELLAERMAVLDGPHAAASHRRAFAVFEDDDVAASIACSTQCCFDEVGLAASPLTAARIRRFVDVHFDELRADAVKMFLESTADGYWIWNVATNEVEWSRRTYQILDRTPSASPMTFDEFVALVHPDDRESVTRALQEHFDHGVAYRNVAMRLQTAFGGYRSLRAAGQVVRGIDGAPILMVGAVTDETARLRAIRDAEVAQAQYARLFESMNDAVVLADPMTGLIVDVNDAGERLWMRTREELIGAPQTLLHPPDLEADEEARETFRRHIRALQEGNRATIRMPILRSDGARVPVEISSSLFDVDGSQLIMGLFRDISERIEAEQRLRDRDTQLQLTARLAAMGSLAAGVGHEINNPLAYVMGNLTFVRDCLADAEGSGDEILTAIDDAIEGSTRVRDIVNDLKTLTRNDDGDDACDPASVCEIALRMANSQVKHRATLSLECEEIGDVTISASRLSQVVINLLTNAAESFSAADPTINRVELSVRRCGNCALVTVRDNGPGIDAATLDRVFEPFFTTKPAVGTGLGLSISRQLVDAAGGNVHISSEPGRGTTVTVRLPAVEVAETNDSRPDEHLGAAAARRLAIVDDDARVAASLARLLGRSFVVATYSTVTDALAAWECGGAPDAVLCDLMMPDVSGADMFDLLTRTDPALARRTLFMTGGAVGAASTQFERAMLAVDRLVHKPVDAELVERLIERMTESTSVAG